MKKLFILITAITLISSSVLIAQVTITTDGSNGDGSAILDVKSTTKGFLPPRMSQAERDAIAIPAEGLMVYNTSTNKPNYYSGEIWMNFDGTSYSCGWPITYRGHCYETVKIGSQCWMTENLVATKYNDGTDIPHVTDSNIWSGLLSPGFCWYDNNLANYGNSYGALYNWYSVNTGKLCPDGWHVPSDSEWLSLSVYLGGEIVAGGKLKDFSTDYWNSPNTGATNESGFTGLPGGYCGIDEPLFYAVGDNGNWWSTTEVAEEFTFIWSTYSTDSNFSRGLASKRNGLSVRCLKD